jgi:sensor histidine kinase YesM
MPNKQKIYWGCQVGGWLFYVIVNLFFYGLSNSTSFKDVVIYFLLFIMGISLTHIYRGFIIKYNILRIKIIYQLVIIIFASAGLSVLFFGFGSVFNITLFNLEVLLNGVVPFVFWSLIYFGFHYLENYKKTEIQNLKWEASSKEIELNKLKSQLNPHFMFNSMNSIRALVDENPAKAKEAVTKLSNILRNTLLMNKNKEILLEEELQLVRDYLDLEKIRYEERLNFEFEVDNATLSKLVPPLIVQAQVENAIKHGISKLAAGGLIKVVAKLIGNELQMEISNTGELGSEKTETGFGLLNSKQRLDLLYGNKAKIEIVNEKPNEVKVKININYK